METGRIIPAEYTVSGAITANLITESTGDKRYVQKVSPVVNTETTGEVSTFLQPVGARIDITHETPNMTWQREVFERAGLADFYFDQ